MPARRHAAARAALLAALAAAGVVVARSAIGLGDELQPPEAFDAIADPAERSVALFTEAGKVLLHPRCANCHPAGDSPLQGEEGRVHEPPVARGADGFGVVGMRCQTCHQEQNFDPSGVPGAPKWHLAPIEMAWAGRSLGAVCAQIKDRARNGDRTLDAIVEHMDHDALVLRGWSPGAGREPAPGDHATFVRLIAAWAQTGAVCPPE
ncbi:MAG TPA: Isoquinoline 1-oxidoreductase subunit [Polyangiaceae bacterium]|nr:Isoquinoline 1-oxidoreductase subunit [Polyangiaceae bacterium]